MLNEEKIRLMTKLSVYQSGEGKKIIPIGKYHKKDYVTLKMFQTTVAVAVTYLCMLGIWVLSRLEIILENLNELNFVTLGIRLFVGFLLLEGVFLVVSFGIYSRKYGGAVKSLKSYYNNLKRLGNFYRE